MKQTRLETLVTCILVLALAALIILVLLSFFQGTVAPAAVTPLPAYPTLNPAFIHP
jgi:hypothetical protein